MSTASYAGFAYWPSWFRELAQLEGGWLWGFEPQCGITPMPWFAFWTAGLVGDMRDSNGDVSLYALGYPSLYELEREAADLGLIDLGGEA